MTTRVLLKTAALALALVSTLTGCEANVSRPSSEAPTPVLASQSSAVVGDGRIQSNEQCDDGNTTSGDGCSATGTIEAGYLCHVPGRACSLASLCGNNVTNPGEACDDGNTTVEANGCSATCDLSLCGNGAFNNRPWPNFDQEICDDGNRAEGDGCSRQCEVEPGFACAGSPSRCVSAGVVVFNTGVDQNNRRLETGADPHWFYSGTTTGAATDVRDANDWPQEIQTARYMAAPLGAPVCVYQDFLIPSTTNIAQFRLRLATFNDNAFDGARVNGTAFTPTVVNDPGGEPWQKNIFREFGTTAPWRPGLNTIELCNENAETEPNAFRYLFVDAYDDRCGDGVVSPREDCDDGNTANNDGCSSTCGIEPGYGCTSTSPSTCAQTCGNGLLNPGEQCDDGNATANDGCNASCRVEAGYSCPNPGQACVQTCGNGAIDAGEQCDDGNVLGSDGCSAACRIERGYECSGAPSVCAPLCGNGALNAGELCDDGNTRSNDGCSNACTLELGYACPTPGQACAQTCGNGNVNPGEQCDDGNQASLDGCNTECRVEAGYACSTPATGPSVCTLSCGNGTLDANETCDDGNTTANDGCSSGCRVETGYTCSGQPSTCATICGDGITAGNERCDDGNTTAGDGCNATCTVEPGWSCPAPGNVCFNTCGNGAVDSGETCDDSNTTNGDGCSASCSVESGYTCSGAPSVCRTSCGDGVIAGDEVCDDGNLNNGDACSSRCLLTNGQTCNASGVCDSGFCNPATNVCAAATGCGNGAIDEGELCDDGDTSSGDGCSATCTIETGYSCDGNPSVCAVTCGDGVKAASEACDDGNATAGDGCSATCTVEAGHGCKRNDLSTFFTRLGVSQCTQVTDLNAPVLPDASVQAGLSAPNRYRMQYVSGAVSYAGGNTWYPGIMGVNANPGAGVQRFSLGRVPADGAASTTRNAAMALGFAVSRDFDAASGDVRLAFVDTDCSLNNNSETAVTYRVDALSICQLVPVVTTPAPGGQTGGNIGGTGTPGATINVYLDGSGTPACTAVVDANGNWSCNLGDVPNGPHTAEVTSTILHATETAPELSFTVVDDTEAPAAPVITGPANGAVLTTQTPPLSGTAEPGSTVTVREGDTVLCTATTDASGNWTCTPTTPLAAGPHTITATATDSAGNVSPPSNTVTFTIDLSGPGAPVITGPANGSVLNNPSPAISGTAEAGSTVTVREGDTVICTAVTNDAGQWTCTPTTPLADGPHTVTATATDTAGNVSPVSAPDTFRIDTQAPDTTIPRGPGTRTDDGSASFEYGSNEEGVRFECSLDGRAFVPCDASATYNVGGGEHTLRVRSIDAAGNVDASPAVYTWTVEITRAFAGGGCSAAPASSGLALLALLGLRRRNRQTATRK
jgi:cysteine-rich repeat protein